MIIQGRSLSENDLQFIQSLLKENPAWHRTRLSREICSAWSWTNQKGQIKDMACRTMLLKLERMGIIKLPPRIMPANNHLRNKSLQPALHSKSPIIAPLKELAPIQIITVQDGHEKNLFITFIQLYHYLGYSGPVGQNMKYLVFDKNQNPLAGLLFGSAAWKAGPRDSFIGWDAQQRKTNLHLVTNNSRFLILPWVTVPHLASHLLARVAKRISQDWMHKYGHPILLLETFVERDRFKGTCYKAANWTGVGQTKGRTRNDRKHNISAPVKDIYLFSLSKNFRQELRRE